MAAGLPVVYSGRGELPGLLREAGAGIVVPPGDPAALAEALVALADDPAAASRMGRHGRDYVVRNLTWTRIVEDLLSRLKAGAPAVG